MNDLLLSLKQASRFNARFFYHGLLPLPKHSFQSLSKGPLQTAPQRLMGRTLAEVLSNSGPLFIKLGQILALREDLIHPETARALEQLFDQQKPMPFGQFKKILKSQVHGPWPFKSVQRRSLGVGSIGQVHRARLKTGEPVIIKLKRPGVEKSLDEDLRFVQYIFRQLIKALPASKKEVLVSLQKGVNDLGQQLHKELNFTNEAEALKRFRKQLRFRRKIVVPELHESYCNKNMLVMEELNGVSLAEFRRKNIKRHPEQVKELAHLAFGEILTQIFQDGHFHADPHGGNFIVLPDGRLGLIDLGLVGNFTSRDRQYITQAIRSLMSGDKDGTILSLLRFGEAPEHFNYENFKAEIAAVFSRYKDKLKSPNPPFEKFVNDLFKVAYAHNIFVPQETVLLIKCLVAIEGLAKSLDPEIKLSKVAMPIILSSWFKRIINF